MLDSTRLSFLFDANNKSTSAWWKTGREPRGLELLKILEIENLSKCPNRNSNSTMWSWALGNKAP